LDKVLLTDITGRTLLSQNVAQKNTKLSVKELPAGLYYLQLSGKGGNVIKKITIQH